MLSLRKSYLVYALSLIVIFNSFAVDLTNSNTKSTNISSESQKIDMKSQKNWIIDKIIVLVNGTRILKSDLDKPRISRDGGKYNLDELIEEEILVQRSIDRHMLPTEADVERQVVTFKLQNGLGDLSSADFEKELKKFGFTLKEYKFQIGRLIASENIKRMEVTDKIVITSQEVENYYNNNPEVTPEEYWLKMIPVKTTQSNRNDIDKKIDLDKADTVDLGWIKKEDLDPRFEFVLTMKKSQISEVINVNDKDYVIEIADKKESRNKTLNERYNDIEKQLTQKKQTKLIQKFKMDLKKNSTIIYL
jgi:parvulin-like peptidyl-prolyl isomerase